MSFRYNGADDNLIQVAHILDPVIKLESRQLLQNDGESG